MALSPLPIPKKARPPESSSMAAMAEAAPAGCLVMALVTVGPRRTRLVALAAAVRLT